jgi:hypothetical protein
MDSRRCVRPSRDAHEAGRARQAEGKAADAQGCVTQGRVTQLRV